MMQKVKRITNMFLILVLCLMSVSSAVGYAAGYPMSDEITVKRVVNFNYNKETGFPVIFDAAVGTMMGAWKGVHYQLQPADIGLFGVVTKVKVKLSGSYWIEETDYRSGAKGRLVFGFYKGMKKQFQCYGDKKIPQEYLLTDVIASINSSARKVGPNNFGTKTYEIQVDPEDIHALEFGFSVLISDGQWVCDSTGYYDTGFNITAEIEYTYRVFQPTVDLRLNEDKHVVINVAIPSRYKILVDNVSNGTHLVGNGGNDIVDMSVTPGQTYFYKVVVQSAYGSMQIYYGKILVPSDAYEAKIAAQQAQQAAQQAQQAAQQAASGVNYIQNNILSTSAGVVQDSQGTVLMEARLAKIKADQAVTAIGNVENKVDNIQNKVGNIESQLSDVQNQISSQLSAVQNQLNQVNNNIANAMPPILMKVKGYNGATATKTSSIRLVLEYANANKYRYRLNGGSWSAWQAIPSDGVVTVSGLTSPGVYTIQIEIRNEPAGYAGTAPLPAATGSFTVYRL